MSSLALNEVVVPNGFSFMRRTGCMPPRAMRIEKIGVYYLSVR